MAGELVASGGSLANQFGKLANVMDDMGTVIGTMAPQFVQINQQFNQFNIQLNNFAQNVAKNVTGFLGMARVMGEINGTIKGLVNAGFAGTVEANRLGLAWTLLSRQIASLFLPVLNTLTTVIQQITSFFAGLTGYGQSLAATFAMVISGFASVLGIMPLLHGMLGGLAKLFSPMTMGIGLLIQVLTDFFTGTEEGRMMLGMIADVMSFFGGIMKIVGEAFKVVVDAVVVAFQWIVRAMTWVVIKIAGLIETILDWIPGLGDAAESVKRFRENAQANLDKMVDGGYGAKKATSAKRNDVTPANFRFEEIGAAFERITMAGAKMGSSPEDARHEKAMSKQDQLIAAVGGVKEAVEKKPGAIGR